MLETARTDLFYEDIIRAYVEAPRFLRRDWLASELNARLARPDTRFVLLVAEPGAGKSSFVAQLANDQPDWLRFFIRRDQRTSLGETGARSFLLRAGLQLAARRPALFDVEQIRIDVQQRIGEADGEVVGASIKRIRASPFHQTVVRITQDVAKAKGSVAGLQVGEWITEPRLIDVDDLQQMALYAPARASLRLDPPARIVILIDALDELRFGEEGRNLLDWLTRCPPLPDNVRIVATSRPGTAQLDEFIRSRQASLTELHIDANDERVRNDTRVYSMALVEPAAVASALKEAGRTVDSFVEELTTRSDGNLGYLAALGRAFDQALSRPERRLVLQELLKLEQLPDDTRELFAFFLRLIQNNPGRTKFPVTDPQDGSVVFMEAWPQLYRPILALLSVALEPLTLDQIHALTRSPADRDQIAQAVGWLEQFLDCIGGRYRLYHATLASFLTGTETRSNATTSDLWVDSSREHRRIATVLEGPGRLQEIWQDSEDAQEEARRSYARYHYVSHLYLGADWNRLSAVIETGDYGRGKLDFDPSTYLYSRDLDLAIRATTRGELDEAGRLAEMPRLWTFRFLRCAMSSYADRLRPSTFAALTLVGREREATDLIELVPEPVQRARACLAIAGSLSDDPKARERARTMALRACELATRMQDAGKNQIFAEIQQRVWPLIPQPLQQTDSLFDGLLALARSHSKPSEKADALAEIAEVLRSRGDVGSVRELLQELALMVDDTPEGEQRQQVCYTFSTLSGILGDFKAAGLAADMLADPGVRIAALTALVSAQHASQSPDMTGPAEKLSVAISELGDAGSARIDASASRADIYISTGDNVSALGILHGALELLRSDASCRSNMGSMLHLAQTLHAADDAAGFAEAIGIMESEAVARIEASKGKAGYSFSMWESDAVRALAGFGELDRALNVVRRMNYYERGSLLLAVLRGYLRQKKFDEALGIAREITQANEAGPVRISTGQVPGGSYPDDIQGLFSITAGLAAEEEWQKALALADRLGSSPAGIDALSVIAIYRFEAGGRDEATDLVQRIMSTVRAGDIRANRDEALESNVELFVRGRQLAEARSVAREIGVPWRQAEAQTRIIKVLIEAHEFDTAQSMLSEIQSGATRARRLLDLLKEVYAVGGTPGRPVDNLSMTRMLRVAQGYAEADPDKIGSAEALRSIALAHVDLYTGAIDDAIGAMMAAVEALNNAPRFLFVPTPWCDTAVAFARLGKWDMAMRIATGLVDHDALDGCCAHRDLAKVAATNGDIERVKSLLSQAEAAAPRIAIPPQRTEVLASVAGEYARAGLLDEARRVAASSGAPAAAGSWIAAALLESGKPEEAFAAIDTLQGDLGDDARRRLVDKLLKSGNVAQAAPLAEAIGDAPARADQLIAVARRLVTSGGKRETRDMTSRALGLLDEARQRNPWRAATLLADAASIYVELGDEAEARRLIEQHWLGAATQGELMSLMPMAGALVTRQPELATKIYESFGWVERNLSAGGTPAITH